ncbi:hypothetical protein M9Y10_030507 [Tritrichomonas musculus]|uniref:DUF2188 domain-containing protein n=1 Tax=Tritrichomonas musculus TaxID=1915356 RepID=A0ABR2H3C4_9EUKA
MSGQVYHVVPRTEDNKWAVLGENNQRASGVFNTQAEAIEYANQLARTYGGRVQIHKADGSFRKMNY